MQSTFAFTRSLSYTPFYKYSRNKAPHMKRCHMYYPHPSRPRQQLYCTYFPTLFTPVLFLYMNATYKMTIESLENEAIINSAWDFGYLVS